MGKPRNGQEGRGRRNEVCVCVYTCVILVCEQVCVHTCGELKVRLGEPGAWPFG